MVSAMCADKRIGEPLEGMSLSDCGERCEGKEECEFHTFIPAEIEDFSKVRNGLENVTRKRATCKIHGQFFTKPKPQSPTLSRFSLCRGHALCMGNVEIFNWRLWRLREMSCK